MNTVQTPQAAVCLDTIPSDLKARRQWVCWTWERRNGRLTKPPRCARTGDYADATDHTTWTDIDTACRAVVAKRFAGIGFVFTAQDPYTGVDLDGCRDPQSGAIAAWARSITQLCDSYTEVSPSQTGCKIIINATLHTDTGRRRGPIEIYSRQRYFTVTGARLPECRPDIALRQDALDAIVAGIFRPSVVEDPPRRSAASNLDDDALIDRASRARNGEKFARLFRGDWQGNYPSQSEADAALAALLAYYTDDPLRIDALFRRSGLCRPKWTDRDDYRARTIRRVLH